MRFKKLDLNLLAALDALLETQGVSAAAKRLNLSQPAVSAALARLRDYFGDELLVSDGKRMHRTVFAVELMPQLKQCLTDIEALVSQPGGFDPATAERTFSIAASDYVSTSLLVPLVARLSTEAPGVRIHIMSATNLSAGHLDEGSFDLLVTPEPYLHPAHPAHLLYDESFVLAGCRKNPMFAKPLTEECVLSSPHVAVVFGPNLIASVSDRQLTIVGKSREVSVIVNSFTLLPWMLCDSDRVALIQARLAARLATVFPITAAPLPFAFPLMREMAQYHRRRAGDAGVQWLWRKLAQIADEHAPAAVADN